MDLLYRLSIERLLAGQRDRAPIEHHARDVGATYSVSE